MRVCYYEGSYGILMELDLEAKEEFEQRFRTISLLGRGSFDSVYECEDKSDGQIYAVKVDYW